MDHQIFEESVGDYSVSTDPARLDPRVIHQFLTDSYWAKGIGIDRVTKSLRNSLCFGLYHKSEQVGLARVITDFATYAYLCDVFVVKAHRGQGLGKWLVNSVLAHPQLQEIRRFQLVTRDAHRLYASVGFAPQSNPEAHMEICRPGVYLKTADLESEIAG